MSISQVTLLNGFEPFLAGSIPQLELGGFPVNMDYLSLIVKPYSSTCILLEHIFRKSHKQTRFTRATIPQSYNFHTLLYFLVSLMNLLYLNSGPEQLLPLKNLVNGSFFFIL